MRGHPLSRGVVELLRVRGLDRLVEGVDEVAGDVDEDPVLPVVEGAADDVVVELVGQALGRHRLGQLGRAVHRELVLEGPGGKGQEGAMRMHYTKHSIVLRKAKETWVVDQVRKMKSDVRMS